MTPTLALQLGDVLAEAGEQEEALRTYSEVVEFDGDNPASRRVLGDVYLRQGWYPAAYRQYKTLTDLDPKDADELAATRARGGGRRSRRRGAAHRARGLERRGLARSERSTLLRAFRGPPRGSALLLREPAKAGATPEAIARKLKELQLFSGPGTLALATWDDLDARLLLASETGKGGEQQETLLGESTDAGATGLYAVLASTDAWEKRTWSLRHKADAPARAVKLNVVLLTWNGKAFTVQVKQGEIASDGKPFVLSY